MTGPVPQPVNYCNSANADYRHPSNRFFPKIGDMSLKTDDINGRKKTYINNRNLNSLNVDDIEGARAAHKRATYRRVDPLMPVYQIPASKEFSPSKSRFISSPNLKTEDIKYAQPYSPYKQYQTRDHMMKNDREDSRAYAGRKLKIINARPTHDRLSNVRDISGDLTGLHRFMKSPEKSQTHRRTNPLNPQYVYDVSERSNLVGVFDGHIGGKNRGSPTRPTIGDIKGSSPTKLDKFNKGKHEIDFNLRTGDIRGAQKFPTYMRTIPVNPNDVSDIRGAQNDTQKRFRTQRHTNPVNPRYRMLDSPPTTTRGYYNPIEKRPFNSEPRLRSRPAH